jgi:hypothetical protein
VTDSTAQFFNQAQEATRSIYESFRGLAETQANILQRLGEVQQAVFNQAFEAANDQLQLISRVRGPREYVSAQADLVKNHGQRYADSMKRAIDIVAEAWQEYSDRLEKSTKAVTGKAQRAASSRKAA